MRHNRKTFFRELTPLANALASIRKATPPRLSTAKDVPEIMAKRADKLARRAARAANEFDSRVICELCPRVCDVGDDDAEDAGWEFTWDGWLCPKCKGAIRENAI